MTDIHPPKLPDPRRKNLIPALVLVAVMIAALGYSLNQSGLLTQFFPPGEEKLPRVDFKELHSRIKNPADLAYVTSVEDAVLAEYDRLNPSASAWYKEGRVAAQLFAFVVAEGDTYGEGLLPLAERYANRAWSKQCRDPLILAVCDVHYFRDHHSTKRSGGMKHLAQVKAMLERGYPAICKLEAAAAGLGNIAWILKKNLGPDLAPVIAQGPELLGKSIDTFSALVQSAPPEDVLYWKSTMLYDSIDRNADFLSSMGGRIDSVLESAKASGALRAYCQADCLINLAWAARGTGWANSVTPEGWRLMGDRLREARKVLTAAIAAYPANKRLPTLMITVELGDGGSVPAMNALFEKAATLAPDFRAPYSRKMYFLQPKWHGSPRAVVDFGRECLATGRWDDCIPVVLVDGLQELATQYEGLYQDATVWKLFSETSEEFLRRYPRSVLYRTKYFEAAVQAKKWDIARAQLKALGDRWDQSVLSEKEFNELKAALPGGA